jgi:hypothetical protein
MVAFEMKLVGEEGDATFDLQKLNLDQMRKLCCKVGVPQYVNKCNKFQCRKALWILAKFQQECANGNIGFATMTDRMTNNIVRLSNIIFSHEFFESFLTLNDNKTRADHETHDLPKNFWDNVAKSMNGSNDEDPTPLDIVLLPDDNHYDKVEALNLRVYDLMTSPAIKKR